MKLEIKNLTIDGDTNQVKIVSEFTGKLNDLLEGRYSHDNVVQTIQRRIADDISEEILKTKSAEIVASVDVEEIVSRVKLQTIDTILGRERR